MEITEKSNEIFISYRRKDVEFTQRIHDELKKEGLTVWVDWEDIPPGVEGFSGEIQRGIEGAVAFVCILSPSYLESEYCLNELQEAIRLKKRVIPIVWEKFEPKPPPEGIGHINWVYFTPHAGRQNDFEESFPKVLKAIRADYEYARAHAKLLQRAIDWEKNEHGRGYLLKEAELMKAEQWQASAAGKSPEPIALQGEYILASRKATDRQRRIVTIISIVTAILLFALAVFGLNQARLATDNAATAQANLIVAQTAQVDAQNKQVLADSNAKTAVANEKEAKRQALLALARQWAAEARSLLADPLGNPDLAALLSLESLKIGGYTPQADAELVESVNHLYTERIFEYGPADEQNNWVMLAITPDDRTALIGSVTEKSNLVSFYDIASGEKRGEIEMNGFINGIAVSSDGQLLAVAEGNGELNIIDPATQQIVSSWTFEASLSSVAFSPDGKLLLIGSYDNNAYLFDPTTGEIITTFYGHTEGVVSVAFSNDGRFVFTSSLDQSAIQWNLDGTQVAYFHEYNEINSVAVSKDGNYLATVTDRKADIWDLNTQSAFYDPVRHPDWVQSVAFSPDNMYFVTGGSDKIARIWNTQTGQLMRALVGHTGNITSVAYSSDGQFILTGSKDGTIRVWNADPMNIRMLLQGHKNTVNDVAISPDSLTIATGSWDEDMNNNYKVWDFQTGQLINSLLGHTWLSSSVSFSNDGRFILTGNGDGAVRIFDAKSADLIRTIEVSPGQWVHDSTLSPDGNFVLAGSDDQTATLWNAQTGDKILTLDHPEQVTSVAYSPDGKFVATAARDEIIRIWNVSTGMLVVNLTGHTRPTSGYQDIEKLVFSNDGKYIASASVDGTARLWDAKTGDVIQILKLNGPVYSVAISPDEKYILTGGADRLARLWDLQTGTLIRTFTGHTDVIYDVAFSSDGSLIVTASADTTVRIWDTDYQNTIKRICSLLLRDFTQEERTKYGITDETPTCGD